MHTLHRTAAARAKHTRSYVAFFPTKRQIPPGRGPVNKRNQRLSLLPGGVQKSRAWRVLLASKVNGALPRQHATAAAIQQNHCLLPAMGALEDRALLLLGRTFKPDQYLPPVRQISGSHEKSNRPGHRAPRCSHSKLQQLPITLAPTQRLLNPLKTHSSNTRNFAVQILPRHQQKLEHKHST